MKNKSEMNSLRYIVRRSFAQLFDTSQMWKTHFKSMSFDSFRKYVSRLVEEHELIPVGKGLYYVGKELPPDIVKIVFVIIFMIHTDLVIETVHYFIDLI